MTQFKLLLGFAILGAAFFTWTLAQLAARLVDAWWVNRRAR